MALDFGQGNCQSDLRGSGLTSCNITSYGDATGLLLIKRGFDLSNLTEETYKTAIQDGNIFPFLGIYNFEQNTPDNESATSSTGTMSIIRSGKPQFNFQFTSGSCLHKALYDKKGNNVWDLAIVFESGVLVYSDDNVTRGFRASMFDVQTFRLLQGTDPQSSTAVVQLASADEFNAYHQFATWTKLGFNMNNINGAIETKLDVVSNSATEIVLRVVSDCNSDLSFNGLDELANWSSETTAGVSQTIDTVTESANGTYTLEGTFATTGTIVKLSGTDDLGEIYKGKVVVS